MKNITEESRQFGQESVESPVLCEMCHNYGPNRYRKKDFLPWCNVTLKTAAIAITISVLKNN